jgi:hypothetical protein
MAHTPGPWLADEDDRPDMEWNIHVVRADEPDCRICFMAIGSETQANAQLIAAAPELLAALKIARKYVNEIINNQDKGYAPHLVGIDAAIAKAEASHG